MATINLTSVRKVLVGLKGLGTSSSVNAEGKDYKVLTHNEISLVRTAEGKFHSFLFEMAGQSFTITNEGKLLMDTGTYTYEIEDEAFIQSVEAFLNFRAILLEKHSI